MNEVGERILGEMEISIRVSEETWCELVGEDDIDERLYIGVSMIVQGCECGRKCCTTHTD